MKRWCLLWRVIMGWWLKGLAPIPKKLRRKWSPISYDGGAAINVLARHVGARVVVVDMGVADRSARCTQICSSGRSGTEPATSAREPAMSREQAMECLEAGADVCLEQIDRGLDHAGNR